MAFRLNSLKTRTALSISLLIVTLLVVNAVYLILAKRRELRQEIEERALTFALLSRQPLCEGYETYFDSGFYKFRELIRDYMKKDPDVEGIQIVSVSGQVLFDSADLDEPGPSRPEPSAERWITDPVRLEAIKRLDHTVLRYRDSAGAEGREIIAPYLEDWGRHKLSVTYRVSYRTLRPEITRLVYATGGLTLISIVVSMAVAVGLASRITRPVDELTMGAKELAEGHFDRRLSIRSGDELQILAETFNHMTERLKHNVKQLEDSNKKLAAANEELKELDRLKSDLLANVSHELRTPLTAIKGYTDYILECKLGSVTEKQQKGLMVVQRNLDRLSKSINALLDFSRMDVGRIAVNLQPFKLAGLAEQVLTALSSEVEKKGLTFVTDIKPGLLPVIADREKMSQVLENLVMNAIKFTPSGGRITVSAARSPSSSRPTVEIRVSDTGIGIPADQVGKIFHRFHQVDGSTTRRYGGVGLGLAIVKSILDAHASTIRVESEEGRGATFRFSLPLLEKAELQHREERGRGRCDDAPVLVAAADPEALRLLRACLEEEGLVTLVAPPDPAGAVLACEARPAAVVLGLGPQGEGLELLRLLADDAPELALVAAAVGEDQVRAFSLGPVACLERPVDPGALASSLRRLVAGTGLGQAMALVVDVDSEALASIREALRAQGFATAVTRHALEALDAMNRRRPDLVVLDAGRAGPQTLEILETAARGTELPVPVLVLVPQRAGAAPPRRPQRPPSHSPLDVRSLIGEVRRHVPARDRKDEPGRAII